MHESLLEIKVHCESVEIHAIEYNFFTHFPQNKLTKKLHGGKINYH